MNLRWHAGLAVGLACLGCTVPAVRTADRSVGVERAPLGEPFDVSYVRSLWNHAGHSWLERYSGLQWNEVAHAWHLDTAWALAPRAGAEAYYLEYALRAGISLAVAWRDMALIDELAAFHLTYLPRFTTLGYLRSQRGPSTSVGLLEGQGPDGMRTLPWREGTTDRTQLRECQLCNSQFFHPIARLIRVIASLPDTLRTPRMTQFVQAYAPLVVQEHLVRMVYLADWNYWEAPELPKHLIDIWQFTTHAEHRPHYSYQYGMQDWDLWYIATAAEMLGAQAEAPGLVDLSRQDVARLRRVVAVGVGLLQAKRTLYPDTRDFAGDSVISIAYFNGDQDDHPDMAHAWCEQSELPTAAERCPPHGGGWDISHSYRIPVLLRALYDNRRATGVAFPSMEDLALIANQYAYRVFNGSFARPLFRNFLDGHDGWYRVDQASDLGYPPSADCDMRSRNRPCLTVGAVFGWGLIDFAQADLGRIRLALVRMATSTDPETVAFRDRYYTYAGLSFSPRGPSGNVQYPFLLLSVLSEMADRVPSRP